VAALGNASCARSDHGSLAGNMIVSYFGHHRQCGSRHATRDRIDWVAGGLSGNAMRAGRRVLSDGLDGLGGLEGSDAAVVTRPAAPTGGASSWRLAGRRLPFPSAADLTRQRCSEFAAPAIGAIGYMGPKTVVLPRRVPIFRPPSRRPDPTVRGVILWRPRRIQKPLEVIRRTFYNCPKSDNCRRLVPGQSHLIMVRGGNAFSLGRHDDGR
jgi:hypothetical protein